jgi:hypothetical protein
VEDTETEVEANQAILIYGYKSFGKSCFSFRNKLLLKITTTMMYLRL